MTVFRLSRPKVLLVAAALALFTPRAFAYIDPNSGSVLLQVVLAGLAGVGVLLKVFWTKIRALFRRR